MKKVFYLGVLFYIIFEIANVFFIMPMPFSQEIDSIDVAYFLYTWRWAFRSIFILMMAIGVKNAFLSSKWLPIVGLILAAIAYYGTT
jgi:hypothetical protein